MAARFLPGWSLGPLVGAALLAAGCGGATSPGERAVNSMQARHDLMQSVTDAESARAAIDQIKPTFSEVGDAFAALAANPQGVSRRLATEFLRLATALEQEEARLYVLKGLPVEFWNVYRVEMYRVDSKTAASAGSLSAAIDPEFVAALDQVVTMFEQHGPERTVKLTFTNLAATDMDVAVQRIRDIAGPAAQVVDYQEPGEVDAWYVVVAPVADFDQLLAKIDFGTVAFQEKASGGATIELPTFEEAPEEVLAEEPADVPVETTADEPAGEFAGEAVAYDSRGGMPPPDGAGLPEAGEPDAGEAVAGEQSAMSQMKARFGALLGALSAGALSGGVAPEAGAPGEPMPGDPNYHAKLAEFLFDPQSTFHEKAVTGLLEIEPKDVPDKKVRARIAQGYRHVAFETQAHTAEGVRGLVVWGGKFSAPLLIQLLEQNAKGAEEAVYAGLGDIATPEAAEAVVARLGASTNSEAAWACLRQMGPVAEDALVAAMPFESPESNLAAIGVLADLGTKKSNALLRLATRSENEGVATAALGALREIRTRQRASSEGE